MLRNRSVVAQLGLRVVSRARMLALWLACEFLHIAGGSRASSIATSFCRVIGVGMLVVVVRGCLSEGLALEPLVAATQCVLAAVLGVMLGNLAKEMSFGCCGHVFGWLGRDLIRTGRTLDGKIYRETLCSDGTWFRSESGPHGTVCEWTDTSGACNRIETGPRQEKTNGAMSARIDDRRA
jgi:hypothetical protein